MIGVGLVLFQLSVRMVERVDKDSEVLPDYEEKYGLEGADYMMEPIFFILCGMWAVCICLFAPLFYLRWPGWGRLLVVFGRGVLVVGVLYVLGSFSDWWYVVRH